MSSKTTYKAGNKIHFDLILRLEAMMNDFVASLDPTDEPDHYEIKIVTVENGRKSTVNATGSGDSVMSFHQEVFRSVDGGDEELLPSTCSKDRHFILTEDGKIEEHNNES